MHISSITNWIAMTKKDWMSKLLANPVVNQKKILQTFAMINIKHKSIEKAPTDFDYLMREYWE